MSQLNNPLVSIITPSYNQADYIEQTILSVQSQDYPHIEHIVVDGGSTDGTVEILKKYPHLKWTSEKDKGQSDAINKGFKRAQGEIIGWLNSDDLYEAGAISRSANYFHDHPEVDLVYTDFHYIDDKGKHLFTEKVSQFDYQRQLNELNLIPQPTAFFRKSVFDAGYLNESYHYAMDYEFWLRIGRQHRIEKIDGINASFRLQPESKTVTQLTKFFPEVFGISRKYGGKLVSRQNRSMLKHSLQLMVLLSKSRLKQWLRSINGRSAR
jgi:glycosyltransferase involved in cell wall biosynthesis